MKPSNLLISDQGRIVLGDYGLKRLIAPCCYSNSEIVLDSLYKAPEEWKQQGVLKSDVWWLGISLRELVLGSHPCSCLTDNQMRSPSIHQYFPPLPAELSAACVDFLEKCVVWDVNERPSARELMDVSGWER